MGDHYIPQHYLSGFSDKSAPSKIWVYQKSSRRTLYTTIKSAANENNRWPKDIEQYLANKVETPANPVLDKIRYQQQITQSEKELLSAYMVVMMQRVDRGLERMKKLAPKVIDNVFNSVEKEILKAINKNPSRISLQFILHNLPNLKSKYEKEFPKEIWYQNIKPSVLPQIRAVLPAMTWVFFTSDRGQSFLTCDNPVCFFEWQGIGKPQSEITFPISSEVTLWATWKSNIVDLQYSTIRETHIQEINRRVVHSATKYAYYSMKADWVINIVNKKNLRLHRMN